MKGVNFFGPNSEYIMSGSDCQNIFIWDKNTEAIVQWMEGDHEGSVIKDFWYMRNKWINLYFPKVNCLEPHPSMPAIATSGLDYDVKMWIPSFSNSFNNYSGKFRDRECLEKVRTRNSIC